MDYIFLGWSTSYSAESPDYYPGETYHTGSASQIDLYAVWGTLTDMKLDFNELTAKGEIVTYDGQKHEISGVEEGNGVTRDGRKYLKVGSATLSVFTRDIYADITDIHASGTDAGSYSTPIAAELYALDPFTGLYSLREYITVKNNLLIIEPVEIEINTDSDEKLYDGTALTAGGVVNFSENGTDKTAEFTHDGTAVVLVNGETLNIRTTGSQTDIGKSENEWELDWGKPDGWGDSASTADRHNYRLSDHDHGTLTVYAQLDFDKNAGTDSVDNMPESVKTYEPEVTPKATIPDDVPTRTHYIFKGWAKDASATTPDYQPEDMVTLNTTDLTGGRLTLYALWEIKHEAGDPVKENEKAPTCTEDGSYDEVTYCKHCGIEMSRKTVVIPATGHDWGEWTVTKAPTLTEEGVETRVCKNDPDHVETRAIPKLVPDDNDADDSDTVSDSDEVKDSSYSNSDTEVKAAGTIPDTGDASDILKLFAIMMTAIAALMFNISYRIKNKEL